MEPSSPGRSVRWRLAETFAAVSFAYGLGAAVVLMAVTGMFDGEENRRGLLAWLVLPILASFGSWIAVRSGRPVLRIVIWLSVIFCLFFVWIAVFSFGLVFLPVPILLILAGFSPWTAEADAKPFSAEQPPRSREQPRSESPAPGEVVTYSRRFFGDLLLENVLFVITLGVGWIIWFVVVAPNGQTPAKKLLHVRIHDYGSGRIAPWWQVWLRELGGKQLLPAVLGIAAVWLTGSAVAGSVSQTYAFIAAIAVLTSADVSRRAIWDYLSGTTVRYESRRNSVDDL